jgi:antitoxin HicB
MGKRRLRSRARSRKQRVDRSESFDEFLEKDALLAETEDAAIKEIIADQIKLAMDKKGLSKTAMAARMKTSRRQLGRLLDPANTSATLATLRRAGSAVGRNLRAELE